MAVRASAPYGRRSNEVGIGEGVRSRRQSCHSGAARAAPQRVTPHLRAAGDAAPGIELVLDDFTKWIAAEEPTAATLLYVGCRMPAPNWFREASAYGFRRRRAHRQPPCAEAVAGSASVRHKRPRG